MSKIGISSTLENCLAATVFAVEATNFERYCLWETTHREHSWSPAPFGFGVQNGGLADMPVHLTLLFSEVDGHVVLFYEATSQVVDHRMVEHWLHEKLPELATQSSQRMSDATNFHLCLNYLAGLNTLAAVSQSS